MTDRAVSQTTVRLLGAIAGVLFYWVVARPEPYLGLDDKVVAFVFAVQGALAVTLLQLYLDRGMKSEVGGPPTIIDVPFIGTDDKDEDSDERA